MGTVPSIKFNSRIFVSGSITALTGLHIGGNSVEMGIGGADKIVVRDPLTNHPYIPGSSLRGKMRSLLERTRGEMTIELENSPQKTVHFIKDLGEPLAGGAKLKSAKPSTHYSAMSSKLFGVAIDRQKEDDIDKIIPQRLLVRDAKLLNPEELEKAPNTDMPMTEVKTEVAIDRITSKANPRQIERIPAGARFAFEFVLNLYGDDDENDYLKTLFECMELLQDDYLGGHGSRGYGRMKFSVESVKRKTVEHYRRNDSAQKMSDIVVPEALMENSRKVLAESLTSEK